MKKKIRPYTIHVVKGWSQKTTQWRIVLKHKNGHVFMHSEYYKNETYCRRAAEKLYQSLKKG